RLRHRCLRRIHPSVRGDEDGFPIGSGMTEKGGNDKVGGNDMKAVGMIQCVADEGVCRPRNNKDVETVWFQPTKIEYN
nr:hypothetical protein [candidate division Zixibacteria bacterium]